MQKLANPHRMDGDRTEDRVAKAIARIDTAAGRIAAAAVSRNAADTGRDPELEARYAALQRETSEALQQLDKLIGTLEA